MVLAAIIPIIFLGFIFIFGFRIIGPILDFIRSLLLGLPL